MADSLPRVQQRTTSLPDLTSELSWAEQAHEVQNPGEEGQLLAQADVPRIAPQAEVPPIPRRPAPAAEQQPSDVRSAAGPSSVHPETLRTPKKAAASAPPASLLERDKATWTTLQAGEQARDIQFRYGVSRTQLMKWNPAHVPEFSEGGKRAPDQMMKVGTRVNIQMGAGKGIEPTVDTWRASDTLDTFSERNNTTPEQVLLANRQALRENGVKYDERTIANQAGVTFNEGQALWAPVRRDGGQPSASAQAPQQQQPEPPQATPPQQQPVVAPEAPLSDADKHDRALPDDRSQQPLAPADTPPAGAANGPAAAPVTPPVAAPLTPQPQAPATPAPTTASGTPPDTQAPAAAPAKAETPPSEKAPEVPPPTPTVISSNALGGTFVTETGMAASIRGGLRAATGDTSFGVSVNGVRTRSFDGAGPDNWLMRATADVQGTLYSNNRASISAGASLAYWKFKFDDDTVRNPSNLADRKSLFATADLTLKAPVTEELGLKLKAGTLLPIGLSAKGGTVTSSPRTTTFMPYVEPAVTAKFGRLNLEGGLRIQHNEVVHAPGDVTFKTPFAKVSLELGKSRNYELSAFVGRTIGKGVPAATSDVYWGSAGNPKPNGGVTANETKFGLQLEARHRLFEFGK